MIDGSKLGGWMQLENSIHARNYHRDLQYMISAQQVRGFIYQSICFVGYENRWMPESFFDALLTYIRATPAPSILKANVSLIALGGGQISANDREGAKTSVSLAMRNARYYAVIEVYWRQNNQMGKQDARNWSRGVYDVMSPYRCSEVSAHALDEVSSVCLGVEEKPYTKGTFTDIISESRNNRLKKLKYKYDSANFFSENANILPKKSSKQLSSECLNDEMDNNKLSTIME